MKATAPMCRPALSRWAAKRFADEGLGGVVVAMAVELTRAGQLQPGLVVLGYRLVEQRAFGVAWVVELGFCSGRHEYCTNARAIHLAP